MAKKIEDSWLWHKKLGHASMHTISKLSSLDLVKRLLKINDENDKLCDTCAKGKHRRISFKPKNEVTTTSPLQFYA